MRHLLLLAFALPLTAIGACSSSDDGSSTSTTNPSAGGSGGSGQSGAGGSGAGQGGKAGGGGSAGSSAGTGGSGGSSAGSGGSSAGSAGQGGSSAGSGGSSAGAGGSTAGSGGSSAGAGGGSAGSGGSSAGAAGQGGSGGSCCQPSTCGDEQRCVEGSCFDMKPGECFTDADCGGKPCQGAIVCPCGSACKQPTKPGVCAGANDWQNCGVPGECVLQINDCCGPCGKPTVSDLDAVNRNKIAEHQKAVCTEPNPVCPGCVSMENPDLLAACALGPGKCTVIEVSKSSFSSCNSDNDCVLQANQCCACGVLTESQLVALNKGQTGGYLVELGCATVDCAPCADPPTTPGLKAVCDAATKHCRVSK